MPRAREPTSRLPCRGRRTHFWLGRPDLGFLAPAVASPAQWVSTLPSLGSLLLLLETAVGLELMEGPSLLPQLRLPVCHGGAGFFCNSQGAHSPASWVGEQQWWLPDPSTGSFWTPTFWKVAEADICRSSRWAGLVVLFWACPWRPAGSLHLLAFQ